MVMLDPQEPLCQLAGTSRLVEVLKHSVMRVDRVLSIVP